MIGCGVKTVQRDGELLMQGKNMWRSLCGAVLVLCALAAALAPRAEAALEIAEFGGGLTNSDGTPLTRAGAHPDVRTKFQFNAGSAGVAANFKDIEVDFPPGLVFNPTSAPTCTSAQLRGDEDEGRVECPTNSQVGEISLLLNFGGPFATPPLPVFNMVPLAGSPGRVAMNLGGVIVNVDAMARSGSDYGITGVIRANSQALPIQGVDMTLWGVPASSAHDGVRYDPATGTQGAPSTSAPRPFVSSPTQCSGEPLTARLRVNSWQEPENVVAAAFDHDLDGNPMLMTGCDSLGFAPKLSLGLVTKTASAPSGVDVTLNVPQSEDPGGLATGHLRRAVVSLPVGVAVNSAAGGALDSCTESQIGLHSADSPSCPDASMIGGVEIDTPLLASPLRGAIYQARQRENPFGSMLAIYVAAEGPGVIVKFAGRLDADPNSGQLTAVFDDSPQLPFDQLKMHLDGGSDAPLSAPKQCGTYATQYTLTSWGGQEVSGSSSFTIDRNCGRDSQFTPGFEAGTTNPVAGQVSPFTLRVTRPDGQQNVSTIETTLPEGVLAKLAGVPLCGDAEAATGNCPSGSQVGSATVGVGAGSNPLYVPQPGKAPTAVYLAGPYKGAPYSLVVKVPAQAGPFDLGTVAVRNAIEIDPETAQASVKSDPLPQILEGIPISYRDIRVDVNRSDFTLNPTSCDPMEVKGTIGSASGKSANVSDRFQVANCERLSFKPSLKLSVKGPTHRNAHPAFKAVLTMPQGGANIQKAQVTLPKTELLENAHIRTICTRVQYNAGAGGGASCPAASIYGKAKAWTPLLDKPLEGPVYLRSSSHQLPDLVASLDGQIHIDLVGRIDAKNARIRNTFEGVPDAPVSKFVLEMQGGKKGLLANNTELCRTTPRASAKFDGQNGKLADSNPVMRADCGKKARKKR